MTAHSFTLILQGSLESEMADRLYEHGCDDALTGVQKGRLYAAFTRSGATMEDAVASARHDVEGAGVTILSVETDEE